MMDCDGEDEINGRINGRSSSLSSTLVLENVGEVILRFDSDGLSWNSVGTPENSHSNCLGIKLVSKAANGAEIKFSNVYASEFVHYGPIQGPSRSNSGGFHWGHSSEMYRFTVHGFERSKTLPSVWILSDYTFGHKDQQVCESWVNRINDSLNLEESRPKDLMVFVHPRSGKGNGCKIWETVAPIFSRAKVKTKVIVTQRAGQAFEVMASISNRELNLYDGAITIGGDGFFNEVVNGFLKSRHKAPYPPTPSEFNPAVGTNGSFVDHDRTETAVELSHNEDKSPLLSAIRHDGNEDASCSIEQDTEFPIPNERFRFGIIPAGSTDAIVMCTTGARDPITSALQIVLGKKLNLDLAQVVRWKITPTSKFEPSIRYAASFAGYGFYGDVISESEKLRWMGPKRYDYAGTKVFLRHRSYEAEVAYLGLESEERNSTTESSYLGSNGQEPSNPSKCERVICRANCKVCNSKPIRGTPYASTGERKWVKSKGSYLSVGAAIISCRNERAPDGLVADAHLSDGLLHLILIKDCPHAFYLWHLTQLARKGGNPLNFKFVEHHKTPAFTFTSSGNESIWNLDGELFQAHQLSTQVFRGLVTLFATGPEV